MKTTKKNKKKYSGAEWLSKKVRFRDQLRLHNGEKMAFSAIVGRKSMTGFKTQGIRQETLELRRISLWGCDEEDDILCDHTWVKLDDISNREFIDERDEEGYPISFVGVVYAYGEPTGGRSFFGFKDCHYSIGNIDLMEVDGKPVESVC